MNVRPSEPGDCRRLVELFAQAFHLPPEAPLLRADLMRWKYWDPRDDWKEPRSYVVEDDGRLLAHIGVWPTIIRMQGDERRGAHFIDWAAAPPGTGAGSRLLRELFERFDFTYIAGGSKQSLAMTPSFGMHTASQNWKAARPIRPWRMAGEPLYYNWRLPARLARNLVWSAVPRCDAAPGWSFEPANPDELRMPPQPVTEIPREPGFFRYLARCPSCRCFTYQLLHEGVPKGVLLLMKVRHHARLSLWLEEPTPEARRNAYVLAQRAARTHPDVLELVVMGSTPMAAQAAVAAGFRIRTRSAVRFLDPDNLWRDRVSSTEFQLCDLDAIFFDEGGPLALC
jgi:hypothetical protein